MGPPWASLVAVVFKEGRSGRWGAVALPTWSGQFPVLAVVEHLASLGAPVRPSLLPLGVSMHPGHVHIPAGSFTAAETENVTSVGREERRDRTWGRSDWNHQGHT